MLIRNTDYVILQFWLLLAHNSLTSSISSRHLPSSMHWSPISAVNGRAITPFRLSSLLVLIDDSTLESRTLSSGMAVYFCGWHCTGVATDLKEFFSKTSSDELLLYCLSIKNHMFLTKRIFWQLLNTRNLGY